MKLVVRQLIENEYAKYRSHLKNLDPDSKYLRFGYAISDSNIDTLCNQVEKDRAGHVLFGVEDDDLNLVAVGHIALKGEMELAFSVHAEFQGRGLGSMLMARCIQYCRTHSILKGCMVCLSRNSVIRHLCVKHGIEIHTSYGETSGDIKLEPGNFATYIGEEIDTTLSTIDYVNKRVSLSWTASSNMFTDLNKILYNTCMLSNKA